MANPLGDKHHHHSATQPPEVTCGHMSHRMSADANARLIAAAPAMLEIIRTLVSSPAMVDNDEPMMQDARAILRAIEGA